MIGVYGGTFDPIHFGHLRSALDIAERLSLSRVLMIPSATPPHRKTPQVAISHRWQMLSLALAEDDVLRADDREIKREGASYTYDTLAQIRNEVGDTPLCLIQGSDVFSHLDTWYRWQELLDLAHIVIMRRAGHDVQWSEAVSRRYRSAYRQDCECLSAHAAGSICEVEVTSLHISATDIRQRLLENKSLRYLVPANVCSYIEKNQLYQALSAS